MRVGGTRRFVTRHPRFIESRQVRQRGTFLISEFGLRICARWSPPEKDEIPSKSPLIINDLQPNPTKSNHPFFIFLPASTAGQPSRLSPSSQTPSTIAPHMNVIDFQRDPTRSDQIPVNPTSHAAYSSHPHWMLNVRSSCRAGVGRRRMVVGCSGFPESKCLPKARCKSTHSNQIQPNQSKKISEKM